MIIPSAMQSSTVGILGLGRSGLASAAALAAAGAEVHAHDDHARPDLPAGFQPLPGRTGPGISSMRW